MKDELKNIDVYYKNSLGNYKEEADSEVWERMRWALFWIRYKWIIGIGSIVLVLGLSFWITGYVFNNNESQTDISTSNNTKPETVLTNEYKAVETSNFDDESFSEIQDETINFGDVTNNFEVTDSEPYQTIIDEQSENVEALVLTPDNQSASNNHSTYVLNEKLQMSEMIDKSFTYSILTEADSSLLGYNHRVDLLTPGLRKQWFSVSVSAGPSFSQSDISGYDPEYLALRNSNESNKPGWSLGVDLRFHIKNWIISTGLAYSVYNQARSYKHSYEEYSPEDSYYKYDTTWTWFFDPPEIGVPIITDIDSSWVDVYRNITIDNSGTNQLKYFEIPLMIGYMYNSNMFSLEINTGVSVGFLVYSEIKVPDFMNNDEIVTAEQMNQTMFNFVANVSMYYHINRRTSFFISPCYKHNLVSVFSDDYPVKQRNKSFGINLGINFRF